MENNVLKFYKDCTICPRKCHIDRTKKKGFCQSTATLKIARAALHYYEEPSISGNTGSGTIFFSGCSLRCLFCQNKEISQQNFGKEISISRLAEIMLELEKQKANNINLVTPTHFVPSIIEAIKIARKKVFLFLLFTIVAVMKILKLSPYLKELLTFILLILNMQVANWQMIFHLLKIM